jgi:hypothetical protein
MSFVKRTVWRHLAIVLKVAFLFVLTGATTGAPAWAEVPSPARSAMVGASEMQNCVQPPTAALSDLEMLQARPMPGAIEQAGYGCPVGQGMCSGRCYPLGTVCCGNGTACPSLSNCCGTGCCSHGTVCVIQNGNYGCRRQF